MSPILNTANRLYVGTAQATRAYHGANLVWPSNIEYIASTNSGGTSFNLPSGILPNDIVLVASMDDSAASLNYPTGYVQGQRGRPNSTTYMWAYKRMGSPVDTTVSGLTNPTQGRHIAVVFRNVNTTTALDVSSPSVATGGTGTPNPPSITTTTNNAMVVALGFLDDDLVASTVTPPTNYSLAIAAQGGSSGSGGTIMCAYRIIATAGAEDPGAFGGGNDDWVAAVLAWRPA